MSDTKVKPRVGDVFRIPISEDEFGFGQVLAKYKREMLLIVVFAFRAKTKASPSLSEVVASQPLFISNSLDAKIWHGHWRVIGNTPPDLTRFPLPNYEVKLGEEMYVENYHADRARPAAEPELATLTFRKCVAPVRLENALKAHWGVAEWEECFDSLKAEVALQSARVEV